jgi:hypothetical protein
MIIWCKRNPNRPTDWQILSPMPNRQPAAAAVDHHRVKFHQAAILPHLHLCGRRLTVSRLPPTIAKCCYALWCRFGGTHSEAFDLENGSAGGQQ